MTAENRIEQSESTSRGNDPRPGRYVVFATIAVALFMSSVDQTIVATALGSLQSDLHTSVNWSSWTITLYALGQIIAMPLAGSVSDRYGRRRVFLWAIALFTIASLGCGLCRNIESLLVLRVFQALGGGALMPAATGIVADQFGRDRDRAIGFFTSIFPIGGMAGPILGGLCVTYSSWRAIFFINVPIGLVLFCVALGVIPETRRVRAGRFDFVGVVLFAGGLLSVMAAISYLEVRTASVTDGWFLGGAVVGIGLLAGFVRHCARAAHPFVSIRLLAGRGFGVVNLINFVYGAAALGFGPLVPLYAEARFRLDPLDAGGILTARSIGMIAIAGVATFALRRTGPRKPIAVGYLVAAVGMVLTAVRPVEFSAFIWLSIAVAITGIGMGISTPASNNAGLQMAPESAASAAGLRGMFRQAGSITGVAVLSSILTRTQHPAQAQANTFIAFAALLVLLIPLVRLIPDHRGTW